MKKIRFNPLYIVILIVLLVILKMSWDFKHKIYTFHGFAQNKETEINFEESLLIESINVTKGEFVKKGDTLLVGIRHQELDEVKINDATYDIEAIRRNEATKKIDIQSAIRRLEAQKLNKSVEIESKIRTLKAEMALNQAVLAEIKSVDVSKMTQANSPIAIEIEALEKELKLVNKPIDVEIEKLKAELKFSQTPAASKIKKLKNKASIHQKKHDKVIVIAPTDGLIGNVHFKKGENAPKFLTLISFYERNPTLVIGFVHENLIVHVKKGDSIEVISSYHDENIVNATVIGLGTRIVEIPPRLRKIPEVKTYGREVMIQLPMQNAFLQKEKVILNLLNTEDIPANIDTGERVRKSKMTEKNFKELLEQN